MTQTHGGRERILKGATMDYIPVLIDLLDAQIAESHAPCRAQTVKDATASHNAKLGI